MPSKKSTPKEESFPPFARNKSEDYLRLYANSVNLESSFFDLRLLFGQHELAEKQTLERTAVTMTWATAKMFLYFLRMHVDGHERDHGRIKIAPGIVPEPDLQYEWIHKLYEEFIAVNPEAAAPKNEGQ